MILIRSALRMEFRKEDSDTKAEIYMRFIT